MHTTHDTARKFLRNRFEPRLAAIRGEAPGGNWIDITEFGLPFNENLPDSCRLQTLASGSAAEVRASASAATNSTE